jgi:hypothetical protein
MYGVAEGPNVGWAAGPIVRPEANIHAFRTGLDVCAGVAVAAAVAALTVRDRDAAPTMIRPRRPSPADAAARAVLPGQGTPAASTD